MIESITPEKWEELVQKRDEYRQIGSCTEPANWEAAESAISDLYSRMGWGKEGITFHRVASPKAAQDLLRAEYGATEYVDTTFWGQVEIYWIGYLEFLSTIPGMECDESNMELLRVWKQIAESSNWWYVVNENTCIICDRPEEVHWDDQNMLHNPSGMSVRYRDGWGIYTYNGVSIPKSQSFIITNPEIITAEMIKNESNAEIRRVMVEQIGIDKFLEDTQLLILRLLLGQLKKELKNE